LPRNEPKSASPLVSRALGAALIALILLRWGAEAAADRTWWGLDFARFLHPAARVGPWIAALLAMAFAAHPRVARADRRRARWHEAWPAAPAVIAALVVAGLCLAFPERTFFTGDFALRRSAVVGLADFDKLFPQAMPLDRFFHLTLPRAIQAGTGLSVETVALAGGALRAAAFAALAVAFAGLLGARGMAWLLAVTTVGASAALGLFTGYDKAFADLSLVTLAFAVAGLREIANGRPGWASGLLVVAAAGLHRSGVALLPAWLALGHWRPVPDPPGSWRWPWARIVPLSAALALAPLVWQAFLTFDERHLAPSGPAHALAAAILPGRLLDVTNRFLLLTPVLPLLPVAIALVGIAWRERSTRWLWITAALCVLPSLAVHPVQGEFRDWDDFAAIGVALSLPLAALLARTAAAVPPFLAVALAAATLVPRVQWLMLQSSGNRSLARIEAWAAGPPPREKTVAASTLEFVAMVHYRDGRLEQGRRAMQQAVDRVPSPRYQLEWAMAEALRGEWRQALPLFERVIVLAPRDPATWIVLAESAAQHGDRATLARAARALREIDPSHPELEKMEAALRTAPAPVPPPPFPRP